MKNKCRTKNIFSILSLFLLISFFVFTTCSNPADGSEINSSIDLNGSSTSSSYNFKGIISLGNAVPSALFENLENDGQKNAFPILPAPAYKVTAKATINGVPTTVEVSNENLHTESSKIWFELNLEQNVSWNVQACFVYGGKDILIASHPVKLTADNPVMSLEFVLKPNPQLTDAGEVNLSITVPAQVKYLKTESDNTNWPDELKSIAVSGNTVALYCDTVPAGTYNVVLKFTDNNSVVLYSIDQSFCVLPGLPTNKWVSENDDGPISSGTFALDEADIVLFANTNILVKAGTNTEEYGNAYFPFKTLQNAVNKVASVSSASSDKKSYTIMVDGEVTGCTELISTLSKDKIESLTICGVNSNSTDKLNASQNGRVVKVATEVPVIFKNLTITGGSIDYGGGIYIGEKAQVTLDDGAVVTDNTATSSGGGIYVHSSVSNGYAILKILSGAKVYDNHNSGTGRGICAVSYAKVIMTGGEISDNKGTSGNGGGGIYLYGSAEFIMSGGKLSGNENSNGGAVYISSGCKFVMSGEAFLPYGGAVGKNDVYFASGTCVYLSGAFTPPAAATTGSETVVATITSNTWDYGVKVLENYDSNYEDISSNVEYLRLTNTEGWDFLISGDKKTATLGKPIYVAAADNTRKLCSAPPSSGANGSRRKPYATLNAAMSALRNKDVDFTIYVDGIIKGPQKIENVSDTTTTTNKAKTLTIQGLNGLDDSGNPKDGIDGAFTSAQSYVRVLEISSSYNSSTQCPITLKDLKITGGWSSTNASGLYLSSYVKVTISDGVWITGNRTTSRGAGIYVSNANLNLQGGKIEGNTAGEGGDAVYLSGNPSFVTQQISGNAYIPAGENGTNNILVSPSAKLLVEGTLSKHSSTNKIQIMAEQPTRNFALVGGSKIDDEIGKFALVRNSGFELQTSGTNTIGKLKFKNTPKKLYIKPAAANAFDATDSSIESTKNDYVWNPVDFKGEGITGFNENEEMSESKPFKNLKTALLFITQQNVKQDYTIYIDGELTGEQSFSTTISSNKPITLDANSTVTSITIDGKNSAKINGNGSSHALNIANNLPFTITNLTITGGTKGDDNGGGILLQNGTLKLGNGVVITGNKAEKGGGVYVSSGATLFMYGTALIGDSSTRNSYPTTIQDAANIATDYGAGIYNDGGSVYIGYSQLNNGTPAGDSMTSGYGVVGNYSSGGGGGIYNSTGTLIINDGSISYNYAAANGGGINCAGDGMTVNGALQIINNKCANLGGGAFINSGKEVYILGNATVQSNRAHKGGAFYIDGTLKMCAGTVGGQTNRGYMNYAVVDGNGYAGLGGAIYLGGTLVLSKSAYIYKGTGETYNDIYVVSGKKVEVSGPLTGVTNGQMLITSTGATGTQVVDIVAKWPDDAGTTNLVEASAKFNLTSNYLGINNQGEITGSIENLRKDLGYGIDKLLERVKAYDTQMNSSGASSGATTWNLGDLVGKLILFRTYRDDQANPDDPHTKYIALCITSVNGSSFSYDYLYIDTANNTQTNESSTFNLSDVQPSADRLFARFNGYYDDPKWLNAYSASSGSDNRGDISIEKTSPYKLHIHIKGTNAGWYMFP